LLRHQPRDYFFVFAERLSIFSREVTFADESDLYCLLEFEERDYVLELIIYFEVHVPVSDLGTVPCEVELRVIRIDAWDDLELNDRISRVVGPDEPSIYNICGFIALLLRA